MSRTFTVNDIETLHAVELVSKADYFRSKYPSIRASEFKVTFDPPLEYEGPIKVHGYRNRHEKWAGTIKQVIIEYDAGTYYGGWQPPRIKIVACNQEGVLQYDDQVFLETLGSDKNQFWSAVADHFESTMKEAR